MGSLITGGQRTSCEPGERAAGEVGAYVIATPNSREPLGARLAFGRNGIHRVDARVTAVETFVLRVGLFDMTAIPRSHARLLIASI